MSEHEDGVDMNLINAIPTTPIPVCTPAGHFYRTNCQRCVCGDSFRTVLTVSSEEVVMANLRNENARWRQKAELLERENRLLRSTHEFPQEIEPAEIAQESPKNKSGT